MHNDSVRKSFYRNKMLPDHTFAGTNEGVFQKEKTKGYQIVNWKKSSYQ